MHFWIGKYGYNACKCDTGPVADQNAESGALQYLSWNGHSGVFLFSLPAVNHCGDGLLSC